MATLYEDVLSIISSSSCSICNGTCKQNDAEAGDIAYEEHDCSACKGTGFDTDTVLFVQIEYLCNVCKTIQQKIRDKNG